ncbi:uncharacterized protein EV422DRAFT_523928 [Fimicolochytrium jonesii]|uniref:uncharacterized protein n=1 Tax=Fimicolochytrium jonesii TaxID=1396493 RepID=UPI0022FEB131|nr:uncharacterized protein EV422DRAFT_523928 [Fimicolochytrium jonesii]KAI8822414.1 hypothetical protein EV422DRAFT_523928 [Fimicolochytrium jonesii]
MSNQDDLAKLTVPLLKAKCKELGLTVGGKKADLIARILASPQSALAAPTSTPASAGAQNPTEGGAQVAAPSTSPEGPQAAAPSDTTTSSTVDVAAASTTTSSTTKRKRLDQEGKTSKKSKKSKPEASTQQPTLSTASSGPSKSAPTPRAAASASAKKALTSSEGSSTVRSKGKSLLAPKRPLVPQNSAATQPQHAAVATPTLPVEKSLNVPTPSKPAAPIATAPKSVRRKPLLMKQVGKSAPTQESTQVLTPPSKKAPATSSDKAASAVATSTKQSAVAAAKFRYTPLQVTQPSLTLAPPPASNASTSYWVAEEIFPYAEPCQPLPSRKAQYASTSLLFGAFEIALPKLDHASLLTAEGVSSFCQTLALKSWRPCLERDFPGRTTAMSLANGGGGDQPHAKQIYRQRRKEYLCNIAEHCNSWIAKLFMRCNPAGTASQEMDEYIFGIHVDIFKGNYNSAEIYVARRFWIALFVDLSAGRRDKALPVSVCPMIRQVQCLTRDIAKVSCYKVSAAPETTEGSSPTPGCQQELVYLVISQTGQILTQIDLFKPDLLTPWELFAQACIARDSYKTSLFPSSLISLVVTLDSSFPYNIHQSVPRSTALRHEKAAVAARFVLTHCDGLDASLAKRFSKPLPGRDMLSPSCGLPALIAQGRQAVQSVHFNAPPKADRPELSSDLAIIQTVDSGTLYVVAECGLVVGTDMSGVNPLWQRLVECDRDGMVRTAQMPIMTEERGPVAALMVRAADDGLKTGVFVRGPISALGSAHPMGVDGDENSDYYRGTEAEDWCA